MEKLKLNYDTTPEEETISPDKNCDICYGTGRMLFSGPSSRKIDTGPKDVMFGEKECACITRQRVKQAREKHTKQFEGARK